jgi:hypothetical protein
VTALVGIDQGVSPGAPAPVPGDLPFGENIQDGPVPPCAARAV